MELTDLQKQAVTAAHPFGAVFLPFQLPVVEPLVAAGLIELGSVSWMDGARDFTLTGAGRAIALELKAAA